MDARNIAQDNNGFIWLAGQQGLTRFDDSELVTFANHNRKWPLPYTWIHDIEPVNDKLLISTETKGAWWFNPSTGESQPLNAKLQDNSVYQSYIFKEDVYLFSDKIYRFNETTQQTQILAENIELINFVSTSKNIYFYNRASLNLLTSTGYTPILNKPIVHVESINDKLLIIEKNKLSLYQGTSIRIEKAINYNAVAVTKTNSNDFFIADDKGVLHKFSGDLVPLTHNFPKIEAQGINKIFHDTSNTLWYISNSGIGKISEQHISNTPFYFNAHINAIELERYNNEIVLGSYGDGLHSFNNESSLFSEKIKAKLTGKDRQITDLQRIGDDLYIATFGGLWKYSVKSNTLIKLPFKENNQLLLDISLVDNLLYLAIDGNGFISYDHITNEVAQVVDKTHNFSSPEVIDIIEGANNTIWLATAEGVDIYNKATQKITNINLPGSSKIISLLAFNNKIFAFSKGNGISVLNSSGEILNQFATGINFGKATLINNEIWAPSRKGLFKINPETYEKLLIPNTENFSFSGSPELLNDLVYIAHYGGVITIPLRDVTGFEPAIFISQTTVSGKHHLLNKEINIKSAHDVVQLNLASLDFSAGQNKQFKYQINNGIWYPINGYQLTLTGLASGSYYLTIMGTNSLGQWSKKQAFTQIHVAYPWYWTPKLRVLYAIGVVAIVIILVWLLYLRSRSITHIHALLKNDVKTRGKNALNVSRNLSHVLSLFEKLPIKNAPELADDQLKIKALLQESVKELTDQSQAKAPDNLYGNTLTVALPFLVDFVHKKYHINLKFNHEVNEETISYELQSDIYTMIYEALISAILNGNGRNFTVSLQEFKQKIWLTISDDGDSFTHFKSKINFDMAMYYIRQIANKHAASVNTFAEQSEGSQLIISIPLMKIS